MNVQQQTALAEDSPGRQDIIYKLALAEARRNKEFAPITLELKNRAVRRWIVVGWDTYDIKFEMISEGGRERAQRTLSLSGKFVEFVDHADFSGIMVHIPQTKRNLDNLATSYVDNRYLIHQEDVAQNVAEKAKGVKAVRDAKRENALPEYAGHVETEAERQQREINELKAKLAKAEGRIVDLPPKQEPQTQHVAAPQPAPEPQPQQDNTREVSEIAVELHKKAKDLVLAENAELVASIKAKSKNYWNTKEYKEKVAPLIVAKERELAPA